MPQCVAFSTRKFLVMVVLQMPGVQPGLVCAHHAKQNVSVAFASPAAAHFDVAVSVADAMPSVAGLPSKLNVSARMRVCGYAFWMTSGIGAVRSKPSLDVIVVGHGIPGDTGLVGDSPSAAAV